MVTSSILDPLQLTVLPTSDCIGHAPGLDLFLTIALHPLIAFLPTSIVMGPHTVTF